MSLRVSSVWRSGVDCEAFAADLRLRLHEGERRADGERWTSYLDIGAAWGRQRKGGPKLDVRFHGPAHFQIVGGPVCEPLPFLDQLKLELDYYPCPPTARHGHPLATLTTHDERTTYASFDGSCWHYSGWEPQDVLPLGGPTLIVASPAWFAEALPAIAEPGRRVRLSPLAARLGPA